MARAEKVLQLNAEHHAFEVLKAAFTDDDKPKLRLYTDLLYNQAMLVEGLPIDDPLTFAEEICKLM
jgi:molecular chaperone HtpG